MSQTASVGGTVDAPSSLRTSSLLKRALFGVLGLLIGILTAAWVLHASIDAKSNSAALESATPGSATGLKHRSGQ